MQVVGGAMVTPAGVVQLSPEEAAIVAQAQAEAEKAAEEQRLSMLQSLVKELERKRDIAVKAKREIEKRWVDDERQYEGDYRLQNSKQYATDNTTNTDYTPPRVHATRARTDLWEARLSDMIFPANDQSWDLALPQDYCQTTGDPQQDEVMRVAAEKQCQAMKDVINTQLKDCKFVKGGRRMIKDACRKGTGILMGPMSAIKKKRSFTPGQQGMTVVIQETPTPEIREGDPWCFFPDMAPSADKAEFANYLHLMSEREVLELADYPDFDRDQIRELLGKEPDLGEVGTNIRYRNSNLSCKEETTARYAVWRYTGSITLKEAKALQLDCGCEEEDVLMPRPFVEVWYCQGCILMARVSAIDNDTRIPYYVFSPFPCDDTMFGKSLPYMCRDSDRWAQAALQMYLHNLSVSSGPIIILRDGSISPADGKYQFRGPKVLRVTADSERAMNDCFLATDIPNNAAQALESFQTALKIMDMEINAEQWATPDPNEATTQTASGLAMLMNAKSILQRRAAACADDEVFVPVIERMIWWNMLYNPRQDIRGDYEVQAKAQTVQLVKDIQAQHLQIAAQLAANPMFQGMSKPYGLFKANMAMLDVPLDELIVSYDEFVQSQQQQQPDPNLALIQAKTNQANATAENQQAQAKLAEAREAHGNTANATQAASRGLDHAEFQMEQQTRQQEAAARLQAAQLQAEARMQEIMAKTGMSRDQVAAAIHETNTKANTELTKAGMDMRSTAAELAIKQQTGSGI